MSHRDFHVKNVVGKCIQNIIKGFMVRNTKLQISSNPKKDRAYARFFLVKKTHKNSPCIENIHSFILRIYVLIKGDEWMMLRDRGAKKWTAMMLPEHVKALREWIYHEMNDEEKPEICDHQKEIMDDIMNHAIKNHDCISIQYYDWPLKKKVTLMGEVKKVDLMTDTIQLVTVEGFVKSISVKDIIDVY